MNFWLSSTLKQSFINIKHLSNCSGAFSSYNYIYCINSVLQKTYKRKILSKRDANNDVVRKYLVENGHGVIIISNKFEMEKQKLQARRKKTRYYS